MNLFFFKKKKIVVDAFTKISGVKDLYPIQESTKFLPEWWRSLPSSYSKTDQFGITVDHSTIKRCDGFTGFYKNGFVIPMWIDTIIKTTAQGQWAYRLASNDPDTVINSHEKLEFGEAFNNLIHLKIHSPWLLSEKSGCQFYFSSPFWNQIESLGTWYTPPGVVNYKHQSSTHINLLFPKQDTQLTISAGAPMVYMVPLTDKEVELKCHLVSAEEYNQIYLRNYMGSFLGSYKKNKKNREANSQCPMGF